MGSGWSKTSGVFGMRIILQAGIGWFFHIGNILELVDFWWHDPPLFYLFYLRLTTIEREHAGGWLVCPPPFVSPYFFVQLLKGGRANMFYFLSYFFYMPSFPPFLGNGRFALFSTWEWVLGNIRDMISRPGFGWFGLH